MVDWILLGCVFLFIVAVTVAIFRWGTTADPRIEQRVAQADDEVPYEKEQLLLGEITEPLGALTVPGAEKKAALEQELREAGYYRSTALIEYAALRAVLIGFPLVVGVLLALLVNSQHIPIVLGVTMVLAILGYSVPRLFINYQARQRASQIENGLPVAVDLLSLCLTGGQNLVTAMARVSRDLDSSFPVLATELRVVQKHAEMVGLEMALQHFGARTNVQEVKNLSLILTHSERLGTDIATALLEFSAAYRLSLRQRAEEHANRVSFWLLFPTLLCLLLPAMVLFSAPLFHEIGRHRREISEVYKKDMEVLKKSQSPDGKSF
jgi:tight adherence protein C